MKKKTTEPFRNPFAVPAMARKAGKMKSDKKDNDYLEDDFYEEDDMEPTSYALAAEIDRQHGLHLDNGRFDKLVEHLDASPNARTRAGRLMRGSPKDILDIVNPPTVA
jgi:hypothetical protein